jgi:hypothetical protein
MNSIRHPNFIIGMISFILLFFGIGLLANGYAGGDYVLGAAVLLGAIHWIWSIIDVIKDYRTNIRSENSRIIWVILVIIIPPIGGMLYYVMSKDMRM